jgi:hypothetical protein
MTGKGRKGFFHSFRGMKGDLEAFQKDELTRPALPGGRRARAGDKDSRNNLEKPIKIC